jgi:hypothetical protein
MVCPGTHKHRTRSGDIDERRTYDNLVQLKQAAKKSRGTRPSSPRVPL